MADGSFPTCLALLLADEGGWVEHDPKTNGPPTNFGITWPIYIKWQQDMGQHPCITLLNFNSLKNIDAQSVAKFYWQLFWRPLQAEALPAGIDYALFDAAVMSGQERAVKWLQQALGVTADGVVGPETLKAAAASNNATIKTLCELRETFLTGQPTFIANPGWLPRVARVAQAACKMLDRPAPALDDLPTGVPSPLESPVAGQPTKEQSDETKS